MNANYVNRFLIATNPTPNKVTTTINQSLVLVDISGANIPKGNKVDLNPWSSNLFIQTAVTAYKPYPPTIEFKVTYRWNNVSSFLLLIISKRDFNNSILDTGSSDPSLDFTNPSVINRHPDFSCLPSMDDRDYVLPTLGADGTPEYNTGNPARCPDATTNGPTTYYDWVGH